MVTKKELARQLAEKRDISITEANSIISDVLDSIMFSVAKGNKVQVIGFGSFEKRTLAPKTARNPQTGQPVEVPERTTVKFKPGRAFLDVVED